MTQSQNLFDVSRHKASAIIGHFVIEQKNKLPIVKGLEWEQYKRKWQKYVLFCQEKKLVYSFLSPENCLTSRGEFIHRIDFTENLAMWTVKSANQWHGKYISSKNIEMDGTPDRTHTAEKCLLDVSVVRTKYSGRKIECHEKYQVHHRSWSFPEYLVLVHCVFASSLRHDSDLAPSPWVSIRPKPRAWQN